MSSLYVHFSWFFFLLTLFFSSSLISIYSLWSSSTFVLEFNLFKFISLDMSVSACFDFISLSFFSVVVLISSVIIVYSHFYMSPYSNSKYFIWLTFLFIASILVVISFTNLFYLLLGWDGLGLVSFVLIVYYQNESSILSGLFTVLINRLGDCFFILSISLMSSYSLFVSPTSCYHLTALSFVFFLLVSTFMTNSAIFPFSPWLPLAISAPTPISALVHSSTLVTSGLFLIIRFSDILYSSSLLCSIIVYFCIFTSTYAGLNSVVETDLNKLIALSTLSHLGFIGLSFFSGMLYLAYFHLLTHALFKSLLFMSMGDIIISLDHSQDSRYLSSGISFTPFSSLVMLVSSTNLLGLPSLSGFFSNDLVLESMLLVPTSSSLLELVIYVNVFLTYYYTFKIVSFVFNPCNLSPFRLFNSPIFFHSVLLFFISMFTLVFSYLFLYYIVSSCTFYSIPVSLNVLPLTLCALFLLYLLVFLLLPSPNSPIVSYYFSSMMFLSTFIFSFSSTFIFSFSSKLSSSLEQGSLYFLSVSLPSNIYTSLSNLFVRQLASSLLVYSFLSLSLLILFLFL